MNATFNLTAEPVLIDLGRKRRATITASVPFKIGVERHCANYPHVITGPRGRREVIVTSLVADRVGALKVWPNGA